MLGVVEIRPGCGTLKNIKHTMQLGGGGMVFKAKIVLCFGTTAQPAECIVQSVEY